jgi:predicted dithiol-disulfide oxidoreductase (DUF899 family)
VWAEVLAENVATNLPSQIVSPEEWRAARIDLLEKEKAHTRAGDALASELRDLPMVEVTKAYIFRDEDGSRTTMEELFGGKEQLIVYHMMFDPAHDDPCKGCTLAAEHFPDVRLLAARNTAFVVISRAPSAKLAAIKKKAGWTFPWISSGDSDFNYDYHVSFDEERVPTEYNFASKEQLAAKGQKFDGFNGDMPGWSVFKLQDGQIYHTYSAYSRGVEKFITTFAMLDITPLGRQDGPTGPGEYARLYQLET